MSNSLKADQERRDSNLVEAAKSIASELERIRKEMELIRKAILSNSNRDSLDWG
jgi:hypothetical protein